MPAAKPPAAESLRQSPKNIISRSDEHTEPLYRRFFRVVRKQPDPTWVATQMGEIVETTQSQLTFARVYQNQLWRVCLEIGERLI